jgi:hypothetical protein
MTDSTIVSAADVAAWADSAKRYPLAGSDLKERFPKLAASHEQLRDRADVAEANTRRMADDLSTVKAQLKAKGGRKR